jgi:hypothetical protein
MSKRETRIYSQHGCSIIIDNWDKVVEWKNKMNKDGYVFTRFSWNPVSGKVEFDYQFTKYVTPNTEEK